MAEPGGGGRANEYLARYRSRQGPRLETDRDQIISCYFQTYIDRAHRVMDLSDAISASGDLEEDMRRRRDEAYWVIARTRDLERETPWLRLIGLRTPVDNNVPAALPGPGERDRVYERRKEKVFLLDSMLAGLEEVLGFGYGEDGEPQTPCGGAGPGEGGGLSGKG
jgi:hypothetical protein